MASKKVPLFLYERNKNKASIFLHYLLFRVTLQCMKQKLRNISRMKLIALVIALLFVITWVTWTCWPSSGQQMKRAVAVIESKSWYEIVCNGKKVLFFADISSDSSLSRLSVHRDSSTLTTYSTGVWLNRYAVIPSCHGRLVTIKTNINKAVGIDACTLIRKEQARNQQKIRRLQSRLKELNYYLRIHNVHDEGYNTVAGYTDEIRNRTAQAKALSSILDSIQKSKQIRIFHKTSYIAHYNNRKGERQHVYMVEINASAKQQTMLLQTTTQTTPTGAVPLSIMPWKAKSDGDVLAVGYGGLGIPELATKKAHCCILSTVLHDRQHDLPTVLAGAGSPIFSSGGRLIGITQGKHVIDRTQLLDLFSKEGKP